MRCCDSVSPISCSPTTWQSYRFLDDPGPDSILIRRGTPNREIDVSQVIYDGKSFVWRLPFGPDPFERGVKYVVLSVDGFSRIPEARWLVEIA